LRGEGKRRKRKDGCCGTRVAPPLELGLRGLTSDFPRLRGLEQVSTKRLAR
jgi:hypothetical protein